MAITSATDGANDIEAYLDRLTRDGESIVIERDGRPVAILAPFDDSTTQHDAARSGTATSAARLKAIMDRSPVEIGLKDVDGRYVMVSRRFEELNGVTSDEIMGQTAHDVFPAETARAVEAQDGRAALKILNNPELIDLILTDVVLPGGLSGPELVTQGRGWQPGIKALFMSGYAADALDHRDWHDAAGELLNKPFRRAELAERVRGVLDQYDPV